MYDPEKVQLDQSRGLMANIVSVAERNMPVALLAAGAILIGNPTQERAVASGNVPTATTAQDEAYLPDGKKPVQSSAGGLYTSLTPESIAAIPADENFGNTIINSIPGVSTDIRPVTQSLEQLPSGSVKATFACPKPSKTSFKVNFKSVEVQQGNVANAEFCPSYKVIDFPKVVRSDSSYLSSLQKFKKDKYRNGAWEGDYVGINVFGICKDSAKGQYHDPRITLKNKKMKVAYYSGAGSSYCDEIGQYSEELSVQVRRPGSKVFKNVGMTVLHVGSFPSSLFMYGFNTKYMRQSATIPNSEAICRGTNKKAIQFRVKITDRFTGYQNQDFQHLPEGVSAPSGKGTTTSKPVKLCK